MAHSLLFQNRRLKYLDAQNLCHNYDSPKWLQWEAQRAFCYLDLNFEGRCASLHAADVHDNNI